MSAEPDRESGGQPRPRAVGKGGRPTPGAAAGPPGGTAAAPPETAPAAPRPAASPEREVSPEPDASLLPDASPVGDASPEVVLEAIPEGECLALLTTTGFGRLAVVVGDQPVIEPVNYVYDEGAVVVRTDEGTKLEAAGQRRVALEVDEVDPSTHLGWSVLVRGMAFDITEALDRRSELLRRTELTPWAPGPKARWLKIEPELVTGRRLRPARRLSAPGSSRATPAGGAGPAGEGPGSPG
jgi:nitroimidazol reductase NimA-like FMN-containing flavoprotein (pyridoxamine 5'-phosphate oxidase superfamily)